VSTNSYSLVDRNECPAYRKCDFDPPRNILNRGRSKSWTVVYKRLWAKRLRKLRKVSFVKAAARLTFETGASQD